MASLLPRLWSRPQLTRLHDPFTSLQREVDRLFEEFTRGSFFAPLGESEVTIAPRVDVSETDSALEVEVELPGVDEKDVDVTLSDNVLTIKGERKQEREEKKKDFHLIERSYGRFARSIPLPFEVDTDAVKAKFAKGVLKVTLPKPPAAQTKARRIEVKSAD